MTTETKTQVTEQSTQSQNNSSDTKTILQEAASVSNEQATKSEATKTENTNTETKKTEEPQKTSTPVEEEYELEMADGSPLTEADFNEIVETATKLNLSKEDATKLISMRENSYKAAETKFKNDLQAQYKAEYDKIAKDPEFSGEKRVEAFTSIKRAVDKFGDAELSALLARPEVGNHLALAKFLKRIGDQISPDTIPTKTGSGDNSSSKDDYNAALRKNYPSFFEKK